MKVKAEIELKLDDYYIPQREAELIKMVEDSESWGECKVLKAKVIKE